MRVVREPGITRGAQVAANLATVERSAL